MNTFQILFLIYLSRLLKKVGIQQKISVSLDLNSIPGPFEMKCYCTTIISFHYLYAKVGGH